MIQEMAKRAKAMSYKIAEATTVQKNRVLGAIGKNLVARREEILAANRCDIEHASGSVLIDRLSLQNRLDAIVHDIEQVMALPDPIEELYEDKVLPNGLKAVKCRTPIGVLGVIYESRPNVTIDVSVLCIKSGNCAILRGGSESLKTNRVLVDVVQTSLEEEGLPRDVVQFIADPDRKHVQELLRLDEWVDLIIPRGSAELQKFCRENGTIPVLTGGAGICHLFVDATADFDKSLDVILNAKTSRCTVCNALDTLLIHTDIAFRFIPKVIEVLGGRGVRFRLDTKSWPFSMGESCQLAQDQDWDTEWMSLVLGIKIVEDLDEAVEHIRRYSRGHSDGILTQSQKNADLFVKKVDSSAVYVNASTRFSDGGELGLGAEIAISTQKLHARGPVGLKELTSSKWIVWGEYHVRN
jgi:glutamate-5-semialdehyde dehydrogenase